ncbi:Vitamin B12 import ATP-binding protein BtuD [Labrys miyagiensis]
MALLEISNLVVEFPTASGPFRAVDGISLNVDSREVLAIVGESGSGKSVSMMAVMGLLPFTATVTADRMTFEGRDLLKLSPAERREIVGKDIAMIFQEPIASLNPCFTIGFQIEEVLRVHMGMNKRRRRERAVELLRLVGIPEPERRLSAFPHQMSGGQCQRVMIAIGVACNPKLLIADEPTTALDVTIQKQILDLLMRLQEEHGMALIMITHNMGVVAETADRVIVQYKGRKMEEADVLSLFESPGATTPRHCSRPCPITPPEIACRQLQAILGATAPSRRPCDGRYRRPCREYRARLSRARYLAAQGADSTRRQGRELLGGEGQDACHRR